METYRGSPPDPPAPAAPWIERKAKLFEAGAYPDKGVEVAVEDLRRLADGFSEPVPVLIEHNPNPLEIGYLTAVEAIGSELFGTVSLTEEAHALVERSGAHALSIGLSRDLGRICEVSLVRHPRVASARLYSEGPCFDAEFAIDPSGYWRNRYEELQGRIAQQEADRRVGSLVADGRLTPAQASFARAILLSDETVAFDGSARPVGDLLIEMLERQPSNGLLREHAPAPVADYSAHLMLPEEADFYARHFPGVSLDEIAKRK